MIHVRALAKSFGEIQAVKGIDLDVEAGQIVGFLGPNGAGKTTTLRMLTTLLAPSSGTATIDGHDLITEPNEVRRAIGYVAQGAMNTPMAIVGEELETQARLYGMSLAQARARMAELLDAFDLPGIEKRAVATLSGGQKRRVDIAMGLLHRPKVLFLDEPTTGLDPQSRAHLWDLIRALDTTVFLTTHYLEEADALCDFILIIDHGAIVASGTPARLKAGHDAATLDEVFLTVTGRDLRESAPR